MMEITPAQNNLGLSSSEFEFILNLTLDFLSLEYDRYFLPRPIVTQMTGNRTIIGY